MRCPRCGSPVRSWKCAFGGAGAGCSKTCIESGLDDEYARFRWLALLRWWVASEPWKRVREWYEDNLQVVWEWRWWPPFVFLRFDSDKTDLAKIYEWVMCIGPLEIRRWKRLASRRAGRKR